MQLTESALSAILANISATGGAFDPADSYLGIFTAIVDSGLDTVMADVTPADATAYPTQVLTSFGTAYSMIDGRKVRDAPGKTFRAPDDTTPTVALGWYLSDASTAGVLKGFGFFDAPVNLPNEDAAVTVVFRLTVDPLGRWSAEVVFNG